jgi:hypothetical protein
MEFPLSWQQVISKLTDLITNGKRRIILVCGAVRSGKSCFFRLLANKVLPIATESDPYPLPLLDLDPRRPELFLPGHIGLSFMQKPLLQAPFTRHSLTSSSSDGTHFVGYERQILSSPHFLAAVSDLFSRVRTEVFTPNSSVPIIVHCPGWYQRRGNDMVIRIIALSRATDIVFLSDPPPAVLDKIRHMTPPPACHQIPSNSVRVFQSPRTREQLSDMSLVSYFHRRPQVPQQLELTPISSWRPHAVSYSEQARDFSGILIMGEIPRMYSRLLSKLLNGTLVSIVLVDEEYISPDVMLGEGDHIPYFDPESRGSPDLPDPSHSRTVGLALIRSIDVEKKLLFVLGASNIAKYPSDRLILVACGMNAPSWAYTEDLEYQVYARQSGDTDAHLYLFPESNEVSWVENEAI